MKQYTIATQITAKSSRTGSLDNAICILNPGSENEGIVLRRIDLPDQPAFELGIESLKSILPNLESEHFDLASFLPLFAVLRALNIDNIQIDCNNRTFPDMGSSSSTLLFLVQSAGVKSLNALRKSIELTSAITHKTVDGGWLKLMPSENRRMAVLNSKTKINGCIVSKNTMMDFSQALFTSELCHARSEDEIEKDASLLDSENSPHSKYSRLSTEKSHRILFEAFSVLALIPHSIQADYVAFNTSQKDNLEFLTSLINSECYMLETDLNVSSSTNQDQKNILAV